ncbi:MAG TPA: hypothetical protein VD766_05700, partial [Solirubrobacterales bacterium]|nr:hypothetical protein [Solirubrobacterales bacterium]
MATRFEHGDRAALPAPTGTGSAVVKTPGSPVDSSSSITRPPPCQEVTLMNSAPSAASGGDMRTVGTTSPGPA